MDKREALKLLIEGKHIGNINWSMIEYVYMNRVGIVYDEKDKLHDMNLSQTTGYYIYNKNNNIPSRCEAIMFNALSIISKNKTIDHKETAEEALKEVEELMKCLQK